MKASWCIGIPKGQAKVFYDNEYDPKEVLDRINNIMIDGKVIKASIPKKNPRSIKLTNLDSGTDEETLRMHVHGTFS